MANEKSGIYQIRCRANNKLYIGSSKNIHQRWYTHRRDLRRGKSTCRILQHSWSKYGEESFVFCILEECDAADLEAREQYYINSLAPALNSITDVKRRFTKEMHGKIAAGVRARAALITHCPHGHLYDEENSYITTYRNPKGTRICRTCNRLRVANGYANETPEQHAARLAKGAEYHKANYEDRTAKQRAYMAAHKAEKSAYDKARRGLANEARRARRAVLTPEQLEVKRAQKRAAYHRSRLKVVADG